MDMGVTRSCIQIKVRLFMNTVISVRPIGERLEVVVMCTFLENFQTNKYTFVVLRKYMKSVSFRAFELY